jgi:heme/copper-type cytochrome/quinol oxidase subunit 2
MIGYETSRPEQAHEEVIMSNTAILVLISIVAVAVIFWLVIYSGRRGEKHREQTTLKTPDSR